MRSAEKESHCRERASYYILIKDQKDKMCTIRAGTCNKKVHSDFMLTPRKAQHTSTDSK